MRRLKFSILPLALLLLSGCATLGIPQADTFNKRVLAANALVESAAGTIETLRLAGKISKPDAQEVQDQARNAALAIDVAVDVHATNPAEADTRLDAAVVALRALTAYLESQQ